MADLMELLRQKKNAMSQGKKTIKPNAGRNRYRILPGWRKDDPTFYHDFGQHFIKGVDKQIKAVYMCVDATYGKPCPICDQINAGIRMATDDVIVNTLKEAKASKRILMNVLALDSDTPDVPQVLEIGPQVFMGILNLFDEWGADLIDIEKGQDIVIHREGTGVNTKYTVQVGAKSKPVDPSVLKKLNDLDEFVAQESEDVAKRAINALGSVAGVMPALAAPSDRASGAGAGDWADASSGAFADDEDALRAVETAKPVEAATTAGGSEIDDILADLG